jgi:hypothetical protein
MKRIFLSYNYDRDALLVERLKVRLLETSQVEVIDPFDAIRHGDSLVAQISSQIQRASLVIAVLSTNDPNVWYETGLAIGTGKSTLVVGRESEALPADLKLLPFVVLTGDFEADASRIVERLNKLQVREDKAIRNYSSVQERLETYWSDRNYFDSISPTEFEDLLFEWFQLHGFEPRKSDGPEAYGIDMVAKSPFDGASIAIEAKKFSRQSRVSVKEIMSLLGTATLMRVDKAALITSSSFTAAALEMAKRSRDVKLYLITIDDFLLCPDAETLFK